MTCNNKVWGAIARVGCQPLEIARVRLIRQDRREVRRVGAGWHSEGSAQNHLTSCQKVEMDVLVEWWWFLWKVQAADGEGSLRVVVFWT